MAEWTFFDTNCLSELVKLARAGERDRVHRFVDGRDVLVPSTVLQELRRAPDIASAVPDALAPANLYLLPHPTKFWKYDLWRFLNSDRHPNDILEVSRLPAAVWRNLDASLPLQQAWLRAEARARTDFVAQIDRDRRIGVDERQLGALVWGKANELAKEWFDFDLLVADCRPENFPSIFVYYYAYYFRYLVHAKVIPDPNDFNDLAHSTAAPYCREFYAERKLALVLRNQIQGREAPTPYATAKRLLKAGIVSTEVHEKARRSNDMRSPTSALIRDTYIGTYTEMRAAVLAS